MPIFIHAGDQAATGFCGKACFDAGDIRIQKELVGGRKVNLVLAIEAHDIPFECADHHGKSRSAHGFFREFGQVYGR